MPNSTCFFASARASAAARGAAEAAPRRKRTTTPRIRMEKCLTIVTAHTAAQAVCLRRSAPRAGGGRVQPSKPGATQFLRKTSISTTISVNAQLSLSKGVHSFTTARRSTDDGIIRPRSAARCDRGRIMTPAAASALSFAVLSELPRTGLADRLRADDPHFLELAQSLRSEGQRVVAEAARRGIHVVAWNEPRFPRALLTLPDHPPALWHRGSLDVFDAPAVAIVGSRAASAVAIETATRLASDLASRGIVVVSGLARGVD